MNSKTIEDVCAEAVKVQEEASKQIDEIEMREKWYEEAKNMTLDKLPEFMKMLAEFPHHYGTIPRAIAMAAYAAAMALEHSPTGGITGFQAGYVPAEFYRAWNSMGEKPFAVIQYQNMLYPQYKYLFTSISKHTWEWMQEEAKRNLGKETIPHPNVKAHWESIVAGVVPFGYTLKE